MNEELRKIGYGEVLSLISRKSTLKVTAFYMSVCMKNSKCNLRGNALRCPIIASDVCDNSKIITNGSEGMRTLDK